jgi:hypothetical protein
MLMKTPACAGQRKHCKELLTNSLSVQGAWQGRELVGRGRELLRLIAHRTLLDTPRCNVTMASYDYSSQSRAALPPAKQIPVREDTGFQP